MDQTGGFAASSRLVRQLLGKRDKEWIQLSWLGPLSWGLCACWHLVRKITQLQNVTFSGINEGSRENIYKVVNGLRPDLGSEQ
jgi:hypothetical protein